MTKLVTSKLMVKIFWLTQYLVYWHLKVG